jgi:hypothetical protein
LDIWQNGRRKIADENRDDCLTQAKRKPPVSRKARKQAVLQLVLLTGIEPVWCCHRGILSRTFERASKVKTRPYRPFKVRIKAHCAALFSRWSVKSIAASNNLKAWFNFNHYNAF